MDDFRFKNLQRVRAHRQMGGHWTHTHTHKKLDSMTWSVWQQTPAELFELVDRFFLSFHLPISTSTMRRANKISTFLPLCHRLRHSDAHTLFVPAFHVFFNIFCLCVCVLGLCCCFYIRFQSCKLLFKLNILFGTIRIVMAWMKLKSCNA